METNKLSFGPQLILSVLALFTALLSFKGCDPYGHQKSISDVKWLNKLQSDSIQILNEEKRRLDSLVSRQSMTIMQLKTAVSNCEKSKADAGVHLKEVLQTLTKP